jgi:indole-3-acetate monooxygenase
MDNHQDVVVAARALLPLIRELRDEAERQRYAPPALTRALTDAGLYQMFLPKFVGGRELSPLTVFEAIEELSKADGSVGWCAMLASDASYLAGWLHPDVLREMCGDPPDLRVAGSLRPQGRARPVTGGYMVSGRWNFASGIQHANWLYCPCLIDGDTPSVRAMWIPIGEARIIDTWHVMGMRGTGSHDFSVEDVFVPSNRTTSAMETPFAQGPLYQPRMALTVLWATTAATALGIARGAIDCLIDMASTEASTQSATLLRDRPAVQSKIAEAEAILNSARAYLVTSIDAAWNAMCERKPDPSREVMHSRLAITHSIHEAVRVVDHVFHAAGSNAIHTRNQLERHFRDIHVVVQHNSAFTSYYEAAGKVLLGLRPAEPGW